MKKIFTLMLCMVLTVGLMIPFIALADDETSNISVTFGDVTAQYVGTLNESLTVTLNITDKNTYADDANPTYKYTVTNGRTATGDVTATTGEDDKITYTISGLKYGDHVKVYVDENADAGYFKVLNTSLENGGFEHMNTNGGKNYQLKTGVNVAAWRTTANDQYIEVYPVASYNINLSPNGGNVAELNASEVSSLYQEIRTIPGSTLGWTMYHTTRTAGGDTQKMAIVIGPTLEATDTDPYKKANASNNTKDMFMAIAAQIENPVAGETYYTEYNGKQYQVTIASDTKKTDYNNVWTNYSGTYTVPAGQTETVFAFASLGAGTVEKPDYGNVIDGVGFGSGVPITAVTAAKNETDSSKLDINIENSTKNGVYVVLDKDMKPVTGKDLSGGAYVSGGNGTFTLTNADSATTVSMAELDKNSGPYTVMRVMSGTLSVDSTTDKANTANLVDIATVNIVNFAGDDVTWSDGTNTFKNGEFDVVIVPHNDQTGKANKTYTAAATSGYKFADDAVTATGNLGNATIKGKSVTVEVPAYGTTSKGTSGYNTVTLTGKTTLVLDVTLLDKTGGNNMAVTDGVGSKVYDGEAVAHSTVTVPEDVTLNYTWQKKNTDNTYTDIDDNAAPSDAGSYNLKVTATKGESVIGTENLPFTITPKGLTVTVKANR